MRRTWVVTCALVTLSSAPELAAAPTGAAPAIPAASSPAGAAAAAPAAVTASAPATAPRPGPCATAHERAQERRAAGKLREARDLLLTCTRSTCGEFLSQQCRSGVQQLDSDIPSVVPVVTDAAGKPVVDVEVKVDGVVLTSRLDGLALAVDPGLHEFSFSTAQGVFHTQQVMIVTGQRNRLLAVQLGGVLPAQVSTSAMSAPGLAVSPMPASHGPVPAQPALPAEAMATADGAADPAPPAAIKAHAVEQPRGSVVPYVLAGAGAAAIGTSLVLVHWGSRDNDLLDRCAPNCLSSSVDHVKTLYLAADISLGVGIAALAGATWMFVSQLNDERPQAAASAYRLEVKPVASGAVARFGGEF